MTKFSTKISELAMESDNESVVGQVFVAKPEKGPTHRLGTVFGMIELFGLNEGMGERIFEIVNDLETEYYLPPLEVAEGVEKRFEECLQRANRRLFKAFQDSIMETELKNINVLLGLIQGNRIFLSQIGKNNAFLFHQKKKYDSVIVDVFGQAGEKKQKIDPEKMFSNIISGAITEKDDLFFCNDSVLGYLSQSELMEIVAENAALAAIGQLERILRPQSRDNNFYAILIQPETEDEAPAAVSSAKSQRPKTENLVPPQNSLSRLIATQEKTEEYLTPSMMPNWQKLMILTAAALKKMARYAARYLAILLKFCWRLTNKALKKAAKNIGFAIKNKLNKKRGVPKADGQPAQTTEEPPAAAPLEWPSAEPENDLRPKARATAAVWERNDAKLSAQISDWLNRQIAKFVALKRTHQILIVTAFVLVFLFSQSIVWQGQNANQKTASDVAGLTAQIEESINTAEAQNIFNDETGAKASLAEAQELMAQIPDRRQYRDVKDGFNQRIDELNQLLQKVTYLENPEVVADFANKNSQAQVNGLAKIGNLLLAFDNQNQNLYQVDLAKKQTLSFPLNNVKAVQKIAGLDEKNILILADLNEFFQYSLGASSTASVLKGAAGIKDFATYGGKLYTLQPDKNQIYKHFPANGQFNSGSAWLKESADLKGISALAIDGGIFTISNQEIKYWDKGRASESAAISLNPGLNAPQTAFSEQDSNYIYVLDQANQRVAVFDKKGALKTQFTSKNFTGLKAMAVAEKEKKIYVLSENKIYLIEINF